MSPWEQTDRNEWFQMAKFKAYFVRFPVHSLITEEPITLLLLQNSKKDSIIETRRLINVACEKWGTH